MASIAPVETSAQAPPPAPGAAAVQALLARGSQLYGQCRACHSLEPGAGGLAGPPLHGLFGRASGSLADYPYSAALKRAAILWDAESLDRFLASPAGTVPGMKPHAALPGREDRRAVIAYLKLAAGSAAKP
jgi:cytochrome c2